ncbi:AraC family ligand binding domain-containing protein [Gorillibacterium massiliense]|uniref:AraC family ligand binding domain-containing protein n=1 Tax=Gorillibacterium massiliense TaxID=1280390 RepID=UPI0004B46BED|nr:AraC family transcriptional regulator [Gorillibacterium massiliense]
MPIEKRTVIYDADLQIETYRFEGIKQKFPDHFHDYYVIGFIEAGQRYLSCKNREYIINPGDITLFNPRDVHSCEQIDGKTLDYRCLNIKSDIMKKAALEITGQAFEPVFTETVLPGSDLADSLKELHRMISGDESDFIKEELYLILIGQLLQDNAVPLASPLEQRPDSEFKAVCDYLEAHFAHAITLEELSKLANMSKYHFLRTFTRYKGISPYQYLMTVRIGNAKKWLEQGRSPMETALAAGFSDQSHFTNAFKKFIGLTPRQYMRIFSAEACAGSFAVERKVWI